MTVRVRSSRDPFTAIAATKKLQTASVRKPNRPLETLTRVPNRSFVLLTDQSSRPTSCMCGIKVCGDNDS